MQEGPNQFCSQSHVFSTRSNGPAIFVHSKPYAQQLQSQQRHFFHPSFVTELAPSSVPNSQAVAAATEAFLLGPCIHVAIFMLLMLLIINIQY